MFYMGIDLHKHYSYVVVIDETGNVVSKQRLPHVQTAWFQYLATFKESVSAVVEATLNWYFLMDWLTPKVSKIVLANPLKVRAIAEARIKTDKIDAYMLAQLLRTNLIPEAYISSPQEREYKNLLRHRISLVRLRTQLKNKVHALLARNAIGIDTELSDIFGKAGSERLSELDLQENDSWILKHLLLNITNITESVHEVDKKISAISNNQKQVKLITTVPGIGKFLALLIFSEIGDINRFPSSRKLCSYAGLTPSVYSSGDHIKMGKLIKQSNKWLRWGLIEAANIAPRHSFTFGRIYNRVRNHKGPNTAKVALARYMLTVIYHMVKNNTAFNDNSVGHPHRGIAIN